MHNYLRYQNPIISFLNTNKLFTLSLLYLFVLIIGCRKYEDNPIYCPGNLNKFSDRGLFKKKELLLRLDKLIINGNDSTRFEDPIASFYGFTLSFKNEGNGYLFSMSEEFINLVKSKGCVLPPKQEIVWGTEEGERLIFFKVFNNVDKKKDFLKCLRNGNKSNSFRLFELLANQKFIITKKCQNELYLASQVRTGKAVLMKFKLIKK